MRSAAAVLVAATRLAATIPPAARRTCEANGVGLAANQVDLPVRIFVANFEGDAEKGVERVYINPVISGHKGTSDREEGCLSLPGLYGQVKRPERVRIQAYDLEGRQIDEDLDGMPARIVQHEVDHLDGVLFIDRLSATGQMAVKEHVEEFEIEFRSRRETGDIPGDAQIAARREAFEQKYCR
jgi:peptide deformylase